MNLDFDSRRTREVEWLWQNSRRESFARIRTIEMQIDQDLISALTKFETWMATDNKGNKYNARVWASKRIVSRDVDWQRQEGEGVYSLQNPDGVNPFFMRAQTSEETDGLYVLSAFEDPEGVTHLGSVVLLYDKEAINRALTTPDVAANQVKGISAYFPPGVIPECNLESFVRSQHAYGYWNQQSRDLPLGMYSQEEYAELRDSQILNKIRPKDPNYDPTNAAITFTDFLANTTTKFLPGRHIPNTLYTPGMY